MAEQRVYIAIDLKSFYASVECVERGLDPMTTHLVVADKDRSEKTICLAVSPALKKYGLPGRARLFEVVQKVHKINQERRKKAPGRQLTGTSFHEDELAAHANLALSYIIAPPRMAHYMQQSADIYRIYLQYIAPEDIHVYSIDEVFIDATAYLKTYAMTPRQLAKQLLLDVMRISGIPAAAGIGTNLYLAKVAMDIVAKHTRADEDGVWIAALDEMSYRKYLWKHMPITDFWRVGRGYAARLAEVGLYTMGDIAKCSTGAETDAYNEELLYDMFGVNAELLIDHAWGYESCTMQEIKAYRPESSSLGSGQVLEHPYTYEQAQLVVKEMVVQLCLTLVDKGLVSNQIILTVGYDKENIKKGRRFDGEISTDGYGRRLPKHAHGSVRFPVYTASSIKITKAIMELYEQIVDKDLTIRRLNLTAAHVLSETVAACHVGNEQLDLFTDHAALAEQKAQEKKMLEKEQRLQKAELAIKKKYGKNAVLKGMDLMEEATAVKRNKTIGGHKA